MEHPDEEVLTQFALDDPLALDAATLVHISDCQECTAEIEQIQRVVDAALAVGGRPDLRRLEQPPDSVWERVLVEVGAAGAVGATSVAEAVPILGQRTQPTLARAAEQDEQDDPSAFDAGASDDVWLFDQPGEFVTPGSAGADTVAERSDRRAIWQVAAAAVAGLVLGAGVTWLVADGGSDSTVASDVKTSALTPFDGHRTSGEISLSNRGGNAPQLTVDLDNVDEGSGFIEAWLLDADTGGMVALGVIDGTKGTFTVPQSLNLSKYSQVDVSREPFDGDPTHSTVSLARGALP